MNGYIDTMVAMWLAHENMHWKLSSAAKQIIDHSEKLLMSPMVVFELKAIHRKKQMEKTPAEVVLALEWFGGIEICRHPFAEVVMAAMAIDWTTDPGDAIIVGQAMANGNAPLITSDRNIRTHYAAAIW